MTIAADAEHEGTSGGHKGFVLEDGLLHGHGLLNHAHVHVVREAGLRRAGDAEGGPARHLHVDWLLHRGRGGGGGGGGEG